MVGDPRLGGAPISVTSNNPVEQIGNTVGEFVPGVPGNVGSIVGGIGNKIGIGEEVKGLPAGVPPTPQRGGPQIGTIHNGPPGNYDHSDSAPLYVGLHAYDYLSTKGLHDAVSHIEITAPVKVHLYEGVEGGKPAGKVKTVQGPTTVTIEDLRAEGLENEISSIAVEPPPNQNTGGNRTGGDRTGGDRTGGDRTGGDRTGGQRDGGQRTGGQNDGGGQSGGVPPYAWGVGALLTVVLVLVGLRGG